MGKGKYDVIIVGSGFAGIVAANHLESSGLSILLLDENIHVGGQLLRTIQPVSRRVVARVARRGSRPGEGSHEDCGQAQENPEREWVPSHRATPCTCRRPVGPRGRQPRGERGDSHRNPTRV